MLRIRMSQSRACQKATITETCYNVRIRKALCKLSHTVDACLKGRA